MNLKNYNGEDRVVIASEIQKEIANQKQGHILYPKNQPTLNQYMGGIEAGELIVISGPPGSGKSLLSQSWSKDFVEYSPLWFQYELTQRQFFRCFGDELPLMYMPRKLKSGALSWMQERIAESIAKYGTKIVFIDHLHYLFNMISGVNPAYEIGQVIRYLKQDICIKFDIPVVLMCHMTKIPEGTEPSGSHVRDSGLIEGECDTLLLIWRVPDEENGAVIKCWKLRRQGEYKFKQVKVKKIGGWLRETDTTREEDTLIKYFDGETISEIEEPGFEADNGAGF